MRKLFILAGLAIAILANAQVLNVASVETLSVPQGDVKVAGIAPDGSYVLLTSNANQGLKKYDLTTGETTVITTADGAGYNVQISADSKQLVYRETSFSANHLRQHALKREVLATGAKTDLLAPTRSARTLALKANLEVNRPMVSIENRQLMLTCDGNTTVFSPCGTDKSYIWPSVSPNGKKVLFYVCGMGAYVCNIDGSAVKYLGHDLRAPKWYSNDVIVAMNDKDNGEITVSSEIVAVTLSGKKQVLTSGINAMYPYVCQGKIVCSGLNGETYLITIK